LIFVVVVVKMYYNTSFQDHILSGASVPTSHKFAHMQCYYWMCEIKKST